MKLDLRNRRIPVSKTGDPAFTALPPHTYNYCNGGDHSKCPTGVLDVFSPAEVVELVNRALYQLTYQRDAHRKRNAERQAQLNLVRDEARRVYPDTPYSQLDESQLAVVLRSLSGKGGE